MHKYEILGDKSLLNEKLTLELEKGSYRIFHEYELTLDEDNELMGEFSKGADVRLEFYTEGAMTSELEQLTVGGIKVFKFNDCIEGNGDTRYLVPIELADKLEDNNGLCVAEDLPLEVAKNTRIGLVDTMAIKAEFPDTEQLYYTPFYVECLSSISIEERYQSVDLRMMDLAHLALCKSIMQSGVERAQIIYK